MANQALAISASISTIFHLIGVSLGVGTPIWIIAYMLVGCATSIWNHCTTSDLAKWIDRGAMWFGTAAAIYLLPTLLLKGLVVLMVGLYLAAKYCGRTEPHIAPHALATIINLKILTGF